VSDLVHVGSFSIHILADTKLSVTVILICVLCTKCVNEWECGDCLNDIKFARKFQRRCLMKILIQILGVVSAMKHAEGQTGRHDLPVMRSVFTFCASNI
jgi:hypothetical protein